MTTCLSPPASLSTCLPSPPMPPPPHPCPPPSMLYEFFKRGIEDPGIDWVDLGASRRTVKEGLGCKGRPVSAYIRWGVQLTRIGQ